MENTMAATPKARLAIATPSPSAPPPPPSTSPVMPVLAFPPPAAFAPPGYDLRTTLPATVRVPRGSVSDSLAGLASWIENAPLPALPDDVWTFIGRAWFYVAGTTMGIVLALALIAFSGAKPKAARQTHAVTSESTARVLVIQRPTTVAERGVGELAQNDIEDIAAPPPAPPSPARRPATVTARRPASGHRATSKDILSAGL